MVDETLDRSTKLSVSGFLRVNFFIMTPFLVGSHGFTRDSRIGILVNF